MYLHEIWKLLSLHVPVSLTLEITKFYNLVLFHFALCTKGPIDLYCQIEP